VRPKKRADELEKLEEGRRDEKKALGLTAPHLVNYMCPVIGTMPTHPTAFLVPLQVPSGLFLFSMVPADEPYGLVLGTRRTCGRTVF
jgi:hypothetical protein